MDTAVGVPLMLVSGAMTAPSPNCRAPSSAAADPARCGLEASAMAGADGRTKPAVPRVSTSRTVTGQNGAPRSVVAKRERLEHHADRDGAGEDLLGTEAADEGAVDLRARR